MKRRLFLALIPIPFIAHKVIVPTQQEPFYPYDNGRKITMWMSQSQLNYYREVLGLKDHLDIPYHYDPKMTWQGLERNNASPLWKL